MAVRGYRGWNPTPHATLIINGEVFVVGGKAFTHQWSETASPNILATHGNTQIAQSRYRGGSEPLNMAPISDRFEFQVDTEEEARKLQRAAAMSQGAIPVKLYVDSPIADLWSLASRSSGQTLFQTSRRTPWGLPGITRATRPPEAFIIDSTGASTAQTVVATSPPGVGEVYVPTASGVNFATIEAPSAATGDFLQLWYYPEMTVYIDEVRRDLADSNDWRIEFRIQEIISEARTGL